MSAPENAAQAGTPAPTGAPPEKKPPAPSAVGDLLKGSDIQVGGKYIGWSVREDIRKAGGSGGLVTAVLAGALEKGLVEHVLALKKSSQYEAVSVLTSDVEDVYASVGSMHMLVSNPGKHLRQFQNDASIALVVKPCDMRGIREQQKRNVIDPDRIFTIGLNCGGTMMPYKMRRVTEEVYGVDPNDVRAEEIEKGKLILETADGQHHAQSIEVLEEDNNGRRENCRYCIVKIATNSDLACGNWGVMPDYSGKATFVEVMTEKGAEFLRNAIDGGYAEAKMASEPAEEARSKVNGVMLKMSAKTKEQIIVPLHSQTFEAFKKELVNCINCGACKTVCPPCACGTEAKCTAFDDPADGYDISLFHMVRFLHLMDSCVSCGQCTDVCPADIPLANLYRKFADPLQEELNYVTGMDDRTPPFFEIKLEEMN
ncbi:MAG: Coenzyme F420 hydrogenase/dehydrogenase, beta subunit C-terminal domain [Methanosarcinales archaeon]|nr:Coenzyme F420 hydrogenase/dehydrogenase, beta subunit C-terminal domain [Methanosarcinales archaeon]